MATRKSKPRKKSASRKPAKRAKGRAGKRPSAARRPAPKKPKAAAPSPLAALARKIVRATQDPALFSLRDLLG